jgi:hypothetical protein
MVGYTNLFKNAFSIKKKIREPFDFSELDGGGSDSESTGDTGSTGGSGGGGGFFGSGGFFGGGGGGGTGATGSTSGGGGGGGGGSNSSWFGGGLGNMMDGGSSSGTTGTTGTTGATGSTGANNIFSSLGIPGLGNMFSASGIPGVPGTETNSTISSQEVELANQLFTYVIHILVSIVLTYLWGVFGANALFLVTSSANDKDFIFPTKPYSLPYCDQKNTDSCMFGYGFPYDLSARMCNSNEQILYVIEKEVKNINILTAFKDGSSGDGVSDALFNYIFNSVYGGLGRGGRSFSKMILNMFNPTDGKISPSSNTWSQMKASPLRRVLIFLIFPLALVYFLIPTMGFVAGIMGAIFGILNNHPFWGMLFSLIFGIFIFFGNAIWMSLQTVYFFGYYPCATVEVDEKNRYNEIFLTIKPYLMNIFYCFIVYFAFLDLGGGIGMGVAFIAIVAAITGWV